MGAYTQAERDLAGRLARWREAQGLSDDQLQRLFGLDAATLARIEAGEIEPEPEVAAQIHGIIHSEASHASSVCGPKLRADVEGEAAGAGAAVSPLALRGAMLRRDGDSSAGPGRVGTFHILAALQSGGLHQMSIDEAKRWVRELSPLIAVAETGVVPNKAGE